MIWKQSRSGFELESLCPFKRTISITPFIYPSVNISFLGLGNVLYRVVFKVPLSPLATDFPILEGGKHMISWQLFSKIVFCSFISRV